MDENDVQQSANRFFYLRSQFSPQEKQPPQLGIISGATSYVPDRGLIALRDAMIFSGEWFVATTGHVYSDMYVQTPRPLLSAYTIGAPSDRINLICEQPRGPSIERAFLLGGCRNYCHWLLDHLPRLFYDNDRSLPMIVNSDLAAFQLESLDILGIDAGRLLRFQYPSTYHVKNLFYPSTRSSSFTPPFTLQPWIVEWFRSAFAPVMQRQGEGRRIFISRGGEEQLHLRRLINHDEIAEIAKKHDFEIVAAEKLSFVEQVKLFSQASMIAGPHGAGFANMVFAPAATRIIEMAGPQLSRVQTADGFKRLGDALHQHVTRVTGEGGAPVELGFLPFETYTVDPAAFVRAVEGGN